MADSGAVPRKGRAGAFVAPDGCPSAFEAGRPATIRLKVRNQSDRAWTAEGAAAVQLTQSWLRPDGTMAVKAAAVTRLPRDIEPGDSGTFDVLVGPPLETGRFVLQITVGTRDARDGKAFRRPAPFEAAVEIAASTAGPAIEIVTLPALLATDSTVPIPIRLTNLTDRAWRPSEGVRVRASCRWVSDDDRPASRRRTTVPVRGRVDPGDSVLIVIETKTPMAAGDFRPEVTVSIEQSRSRLCFRSSALNEPARIVASDTSAGESKAVDAAMRMHAGRIAALEYREWLRTRHALDAFDRADAAALAESLPADLSVGVVVAADGDGGRLADTLASLEAQIYRRWRLISSTDDAFDDTALRIHLQPGDQLEPHALLFIAGTFFSHPTLQWLYWDSDEIDPDGQFHRPRLLAAPDPDLILATDWMVVSGAFRTTALKEACKPPTVAPTGDHQEAGLMVFERFGLESIRHLPCILHHRMPLPRGEALSRSLRREQVVRAHFQRTGQAACVTSDHRTPGVHIRYTLPQPEPMVSIIIATRDRFDLLARCIGSIERYTDYPRYEILIVDNGSEEAETLAYLAELQAQGLAEVIRHDGPFNWSALNNAAAKIAAGPILCLLNNDVEIISAGWLGELVREVSRPGIGVAGATLWYPDNTLQQAGVALMPSRLSKKTLRSPAAFHAYAGDVDRLAVPEALCFTRTWSAATGACLVTRRAAFMEIGGMEERYLPISWNDVDYCLRLQEELGLRTVVTPHAELLHLESASRRTEAEADQTNPLVLRDRAYLRNCWVDLFDRDPHFSPHLSRTRTSTPLSNAPTITPRAILRRLADAAHVSVIHIPRAGGVAFRERFVAELSRRDVLVLSPRHMMECYEGDRVAIGAVRGHLEEAAVLYSHASHGFSEMIGIDCAYGTVLRDPVERIVSHWRHLTEAPFGPLAETPLAAMDLADAIRKGLVPANLMSRMLLGDKVEDVRWAEIMAAGRAYGGDFCGFGVPASVWRGEIDDFLSQPPTEPDHDLSRLDSLMERLDTDFAFVGTLEAIEPLLAALVRHFGWREQAPLVPLNAAPSPPEDLDPSIRALIEEYNQLDRALYDRIAARPDAYFINPDALARFSGDRGGARRRGAAA